MWRDPDTGWAISSATVEDIRLRRYGLGQNIGRIAYIYGFDGTAGGWLVLRILRESR